MRFNLILKRCCCCFDLRTGVILLGWIGIMCAISFFIMSFSLFAYRKEIILHFPALETGMVPLTITSIFCLFVKILSNIFLLSGAMRKNHLELLPWLIINKITIAFIIFVVIYIGAILGRTDTISSILVFLFGLVIIIGLLYIWLCVFSLYQYLQDESKIDDYDIVNNDHILIIENEMATDVTDVLMI